MVIDMMDKITGAIEDLAYRDEELFQGSVKCPKCGQDHGYQGIEEGCKCSQCNEPLNKELF